MDGFFFKNGIIFLACLFETQIRVLTNHKGQIQCYWTKKSIRRIGRSRFLKIHYWTEPVQATTTTEKKIRSRKKKKKKEAILQKQILWWSIDNLSLDRESCLLRSCNVPRKSTPTNHRRNVIFLWLFYEYFMEFLLMRFPHWYPILMNSSEVLGWRHFTVEITSKKTQVLFW